jgi:hypothetical protein
MATISMGYANLLPPLYFKMTLSYIIHVLVLYQGDVFVCRFEKVTSQEPIKLKPKHHIDANSLHDTLQSAVCNLQSAYRAQHSTETALLRVHHDIVSELDKNCCVVLLMLDLSAAYDVVNHTILLERLNYSFGISDSALSWIESYLKDRSQRVAIGTVQSDDLKLQCGVPQGFV